MFIECYCFFCFFVLWIVFVLMVWVVLVILVYVVFVCFQDLQVEVIGSGCLVLMIFGFNSGVEVWCDICVVLQLQVQCYLVQLFGFVGVLLVVSDDFFVVMCDWLLVYVVVQWLEYLVVIGYSLGGVVVLQMVIEVLDWVGLLVIVDVLFYFDVVCDLVVILVLCRVVVVQECSILMVVEDVVYCVSIDCFLVSMICLFEYLVMLQQWGCDSDWVIIVNVMYLMSMIDLCELIVVIIVLVLVFGVWVVYQLYGVMFVFICVIFVGQYVCLLLVCIEMSVDGYYFLMWDDLCWLQVQVCCFFDLFVCY